ncbi:MAG: fasciclin domain-containing protein [Bacteroidota bacterium]
MKVHYYAWSVLLLLVPALLFVSCEEDEMDPTVVEFAQDNTQFSILVDALEAADLVDALNDRSAELTVFAPTNTAFEAFLSENGYQSLDDVPVATLRQVLSYHVLGTKQMSDKLEDQYYPTLAEFAPNAPLNLYVDTRAGVKINADVDVTAADTEVDNGVIHTVDKVINPANVVTLALSNPMFSNLIAALTRTDLQADFVGILSGDGPFTVFAPTNTAFENLLAAVPEWNTLADIPRETLETVLSYHVIANANVRAAQIVDDAPVTTFEGRTFSIDLTAGTPTITTASDGTAGIIATDVQGTNGVVHAIDAVLLPE